MYLIEYRIVLVTFFIVAGTTACVTCRRDLTFVPSAAAVFSGLDLFTAAFVTSHPCLCDTVMETTAKDAMTSLEHHIDAHLWCDEGDRLYTATCDPSDEKGGRQRWQKQIQNSFAKHVPAVESQYGDLYRQVSDSTAFPSLSPPSIVHTYNCTGTLTFWCN